MKRQLCIAACIAVAVAACGPNIRVTTTAAPYATFSHLHTFQILRPTPRMPVRSQPDDPMLVNSISHEVLLGSITDAFLAKGYGLDPVAPDFQIAYYASSRERLNVTVWDYGYPGRWGGWRGPGMGVVDVEPYTEGTVIIDVIDPKTKELMWRGRGQAVTTSDPAEFQRNLRETVQAIVKKFPSATKLAAR